MKRFTDLDVWKKSRSLCKKLNPVVIRLTDLKMFGLSNQISRSSGSVMDNIAEGFERGGNKELVQFLYISKGSCGELKSQLFRALDVEAISPAEFNELMNEADEISKMLVGFIKYLQGSEVKGAKYYVPSKEDPAAGNSEVKV
jgi:four helix bundle protein